VSLNEGTNYLKIRSKDTAGNYSPWSDVCAITYDSIAPVLAGKTTFTGWYSAGQTSTFTYTDANLTDEYASPTCQILTEGENQTCSIEPNVCDRASNCNTESVVSSPANIDLTNPTINLAAWGSTINGTAYDSLSGIERVDLQITKPDSSQYTATATGTNDWTYTMSEAPLGDYKVVATAYDRAGNQSQAGKDFTMSPTAGDGSTASVLGAAPSSSPNNRRTKLVSPEPSPEPSTEPIVESGMGGGQGVVMGASTGTTENKNYWRWLLLLTHVTHSLPLCNTVG
jgi:hypothetical protein